jgi:hypothetical protein
MFKGRVDVSITYPDPDETPLETPVALPTSEPASPQVSFTLATKHFPVWSPYELPHSKLAMLYAGGAYDKSNGNMHIYCRVLKNGQSLYTGSSNVSTTYSAWTVSVVHDALVGIAVDDIVQLKLWGQYSGLTLDYRALACCVTRVESSTPAISDIKVATQTCPLLQLGTPAVYSNGKLLLANDDVVYPTNTTVLDAKLLVSGSKGLCRLQYGDNTSYVINVSRNNRPSYYCNEAPTRIAYTPLNLRV